MFLGLGATCRLRQYGRMTRKPDGPLRTGFTTGACATAAAAAAAGWLTGAGWADPVRIRLPRGQEVEFPLAETAAGDGWAEAAVRKDAGDDPDVTHGAIIRARITAGSPGQGLRFLRGAGVGLVTRPGLPVAVGEPAINPVPRKMITEALTGIAAAANFAPDFDLTISVDNGAEIALQTWNPRLGIEGGLSILGTTGIVRPFSCAAWIASIHRGVDVARAGGLAHVVGSTGATSESTARRHFALPDHAMLDMGDFAGGMLKYLRRHPVARVTIAGGFGKLTKLAQGALDLHSARSQIDFERLADWAGTLGHDADAVRTANTALEVLGLTGPDLAGLVAGRARDVAQDVLGDAGRIDILVVARDGTIIAETP